MEGGHFYRGRSLLSNVAPPTHSLTLSHYLDGVAPPVSSSPHSLLDNFYKKFREMRGKIQPTPPVLEKIEKYLTLENYLHNFFQSAPT